MARFLADENIPQSAVYEARADGHDITWIAEIVPGISDEEVLAQSLIEQRVVLTLDKGFGELAFQKGNKATPGIILLRPHRSSPGYLTKF
ncbi:MAG: DUF5615 family PIN-like protein [Planctomycetales bacterium]